jgi:hypothetical protein
VTCPAGSSFFDLYRVWIAASSYVTIQNVNCPNFRIRNSRIDAAATLEMANIVTSQAFQLTSNDIANQGTLYVRDSSVGGNMYVYANNFPSSGYLTVRRTTVLAQFTLSGGTCTDLVVALNNNNLRHTLTNPTAVEITPSGWSNPTFLIDGNVIYAKATSTSYDAIAFAMVSSYTTGGKVELTNNAITAEDQANTLASYMRRRPINIATDLRGTRFVFSNYTGIDGNIYVRLSGQAAPFAVADVNNTKLHLEVYGTVDNDMTFRNLRIGTLTLTSNRIADPYTITSTTRR